MATILRIPKLDLSIQDTGEIGPLKSYSISKCCCVHDTEKVDDKKE